MYWNISHSRRCMVANFGHCVKLSVCQDKNWLQSARTHVSVISSLHGGDFTRRKQEIGTLILTEEIIKEIQNTLGLILYSSIVVCTSRCTDVGYTAPHETCASDRFEHNLLMADRRTPPPTTTATTTKLHETLFSFCSGERERETALNALTQIVMLEWQKPATVVEWQKIMRVFSCNECMR